MRHYRSVGQQAQAILEDLTGAPALPGAACREGDGYVTMTLFLDAGRGVGQRLRPLAAAVCGSCPARAACLAWAIVEEQPSGSWGGMYGGLTAPERLRRYGYLSRPERLAAARSAVTDVLAAPLAP